MLYLENKMEKIDYNLLFLSNLELIVVHLKSIEIDFLSTWFFKIKCLDYNSYSTLKNLFNILYQF